MHKCNHCGKDETQTTFSTRTVSGKRYLYFICKLCKPAYAKTVKRNPESKKAYTKKRVDKDKADRAAGVNRDKWLLIDSRRWDKKRGFDNDLTREFIKPLIDSPCVYCGDTTIRMTLDRTDNTKGHLQSNVVGSCARCNFLRRDMPYEAWLGIVDAIRSVRALGLFGDWLGGPKNSGWTAEQRQVVSDSWGTNE